MHVIAIDVDGTALKYPKQVRRLYEQRDTFIVMYTARSEQLRDITVVQLQKANIPYHALVMGKLRADMYVDDRNAGGLQWPE